ncbi:hypothetical protein SNE40_011310 [Patella caerulea]|uniref:Structural maintenance of chromosomes protein 5 n=1 Tax=Patella caerulea TaxID=87958 RepID=A0AAN8JLB5_PATCE
MPKANATSSSQKGKNYVEGSIVRIKLENILTYDSVEFHPGPNLNVIIGPNGTGKSTIVCAICLGLAGKTGLLGRASQFSEFIKYGNSEGKIELELFNSKGDNYVIKREIHKNNTSTWNVNGRQATQKAVEETVSRLSIQVGNLCQFLPQEKVADFAKMTQQEMLENTEKAVGGMELYENHQKLKDARKQARTLESDFTTLKDRLEQDKQKNARLEQDVKNFDERQTHLKRINLLKQKKPWLEYQETRKRYITEKDQLTEKEMEVKKARATFAPLEKKLNSTKARKESFEVQMKQKSTTIKEYADKVRSSSEELESWTDKITDIQKDLKFKQEQEEARKKKLVGLKKQLQVLEKELSQLDTSEDVQPAIEKINLEMRNAGTELSNITQRGESLKMEISNKRREIADMQTALRRIQDISNHRLELVRRKHKDTYDAVIWLRQNIDQFKGAICEPMMLCVNVKNPGDAKYIETHISFNDMRTFVCEDPEDLEKFMSVVRDRQNLRVNAAKMPVQSVSSFKARYEIDHYRRYGFHHYLKDMFDCPDPVMRYLCCLYRVHCIPVGNKYTKDNVAGVIKDHSELSTFYTVDTQYTIKKSKYDGSTSTRNTTVRDGSILNISMDLERENQLKRQLQNCEKAVKASEEKYHELQKKSREWDATLNQLREQKKKLQEMKGIERRLQTQIQQKKDSMQRVENEEIDLSAEAVDAKKKIKDITLKKCQLLKVLKSNTSKCMELSKGKARLSIQSVQAIQEYQTTEAELKDQTHFIKQEEKILKDLKDEVVRIKNDARNQLTTAKKATNTPQNEDLSQEMKNAFSTLPLTLEDIEAAIHEEQARADCSFQIDERIVIEYNNRKEEIANLEKVLDERLNAKESHQEEITRAKEQWLGPLQELIGKINQNFSYFLECMKCAGEVELAVPENPEDYEKYAVKIKVKYRDADALRELTPHHQSGGERSVATVLYMLALQELAKCPFRCVDEINQGMDPVNERKVFELVVQTVCKKANSQYFLLTPKLLPDLEYADNMTVLCVYNGPKMMNHTDWKLKHFLRRRQNLTVDP